MGILDRFKPRTVEQSDDIWPFLKIPSRAKKLDDASLTNLIRLSATTYGKTNNEIMISGLKGLYELFVSRISAADRDALCAELQDAISARTTSATALLPFLDMDPDPTVASTAAFGFSVLYTPQGGDLMTAPKVVMEGMLGGSSLCPGGLLGGLLLLGDERVNTMLWEQKEEFSNEVIEVAMHCQTGFLSYPLVDFLISWLEELPGDTGDELFAILASGLAGCREGPAPMLVTDAERHFPAPVESKDPVRVKRSWTLEEFAGIIMPSLLALETQEGEPKVMPRVMKAWRAEPPAEPEPAAQERAVEQAVAEVAPPVAAPTAHHPPPPVEAPAPAKIEEPVAPPAAAKPASAPAKPSPADANGQGRDSASVAASAAVAANAALAASAAAAANAALAASAPAAAKPPAAVPTPPPVSDVVEATPSATEPIVVDPPRGATLLEAVSERYPKIQGLFPKPLSGDFFFEELFGATLQPIVQWGTFDPFGPTLRILGLFPIHGEDVSLLVLRTNHPLTPSVEVVGATRRSAEQDHDHQMEMAAALCAASVARGKPLLDSVPTHVVVEGGLPLAQARTLFLEWVRRCAPAGVAKANERHERHWLKPWDRAREAINEKVASVESGAAKTAPPASEGDLARWWSIATDPHHLIAEFEAIPLAWASAVNGTAHAQGPPGLDASAREATAQASHA